MTSKIHKCKRVRQLVVQVLEYDNQPGYQVHIHDANARSIESFETLDQATLRFADFQ